MRRYSAVVTFLLLLAVAAWGQELRQLNVSPDLPAASGTMGVSHDTSGTTYINLQVKHLARPDALHPAKAAFVVWVQPTGEPPQNHGVLQVNDKLEVTYSTTVHTNNFDVFVTAEDNPNAMSPTGSHLLSAHN